MKTYKQFHGDILISNIGKELRLIVKTNKTSFKVLTGYGSFNGKSSSKGAVLKSLSKMKKEGLISGYFPGEVKSQILKDNSVFYDYKLKYETRVKKDYDYGNAGIIFIFI